MARGEGGEWHQVGEAVLYSFGTCTISSVLPALMRAGDVALVDEGVGYGVLAGLRLSKATVRTQPPRGVASTAVRPFGALVEEPDAERRNAEECLVRAIGEGLQKATQPPRALL